MLLIRFESRLHLSSIDRILAATCQQHVIVSCAQFIVGHTSRPRVKQCRRAQHDELIQLQNMLYTIIGRQQACRSVIILPSTSHAFTFFMIPSSTRQLLHY
jgi:hypothetical protein